MHGYLLIKQLLGCQDFDDNIFEQGHLFHRKRAISYQDSFYKMIHSTPNIYIYKCEKCGIYRIGTNIEEHKMYKVFLSEDQYINSMNRLTMFEQGLSCSEHIIKKIII